MKADKRKLIAVIEMKVDERGIWLPSYELESGIGKYIDRLNRRSMSATFLPDDKA
jgi:hypothetical protein